MSLIAPGGHDPNLFRGVGVEVTLAKPDDFLKVRETLERIGIASKQIEGQPVNKTLTQSCHILHKRGRFAIVHFKELFILDGKPSDLSDNDLARRNTIANLLSEWGLVKLVNSDSAKAPIAPLNQIKIISFKEKADWTLVTKYSIGKTKRGARVV